jgi:hypothetical protein
MAALEVPRSVSLERKSVKELTVWVTSLETEETSPRNLDAESHFAAFCHNCQQTTAELKGRGCVIQMPLWF